MIERHAVEKELTFYDAAQELVRKPQLFDLLLRACGNWFTGKPPTSRAMRTWRNRHKVEIARKWPNLTPEQILYAMPYLSLEQRRKSRPSVVEQRKTNARELLAEPHNKTLQEIHAITGVPLSTLYRWFPQKSSGQPKEN